MNEITALKSYKGLFVVSSLMLFIVMALVFYTGNEPIIFILATTLFLLSFYLLLIKKKTWPSILINVFLNTGYYIYFFVLTLNGKNFIEERGCLDICLLEPVLSGIVKAFSVIPFYISIYILIKILEGKGKFTRLQYLALLILLILLSAFSFLFFLLVF